MRKRQLLIIFVTVFIDLIGFGIIIPLSPYLAREFGADALDVGLLMAIYSGMQFIFSPFWGRLSDKWGRRPIILLSLFGAGLSHLLFAFSGSLMLLFVARALAGIFGANISTAMAYIADITDEKNRSKGMGLIGAAFGLGFVLGPALGAYFGNLGQSLGTLPPFGYSFAAVAAGVICLVNFTLAIRFLPESLDEESRDRLPPRLTRREMIIQFSRRPVMNKLMLMFLFATLAMANMEASLFLLVKDDFGWTLVQAGLGFAYVGLIMVFTQGFLVRRFLPKWGERKVLFLGLILGGVGFVGIGFSATIPMMAIAVTLLGIGNGLTHPSITGSISLLSGKKEQGLVMGVNQSLAAIGRIVGPAIGGLLYRDIGHQYPFVAAGLLNLVAIGIGLSIFKRMPVSAKGESEEDENSKNAVEQSSKSIPNKTMFIGGFQLFNIVENDVPCKILDLCQEERELNDRLVSVLSRKTLIEFKDVNNHLNSTVQDKAYPVLLICEDGLASTEAADSLVKDGYLNVYVIEGGLDQLQQYVYEY